MTLFQKYSPTLIVELQKYISKSQSITLTENTDINDLLMKDSIYNATGLAVFSLFDEVGRQPRFPLLSRLFPFLATDRRRD